MKAISKAELELEKLISKLEGQLASAHYALSLLRSKNTEVPHRAAAPTAEPRNRVAVGHNDIPLFS